MIWWLRNAFFWPVLVDASCESLHLSSGPIGTEGPVSPVDPEVVLRTVTNGPVLRVRGLAHRDGPAHSAQVRLDSVR